MYSQANVREESVLRPPTRALPSVIVDTEKVLREVDGPEESDFHPRRSLPRVERCSPRGAPQNRTVRAGRSPKNTSVTRKQLTSRPDHLWPELWKSMGKNAKLKEKQKWSEEKIHVENARRLRGTYFIDPEDKEFKETIKNARKKLETSVAPAMPCKIMKNCGSGASNNIKTKLACILEGDESTRMRMGNSMPHYHEDHIAGEGENSLQNKHSVHKFIPMPQAMKIPAAKAAKAAVDKEWEKVEKISAWNLAKVKSKKQVDR